MESIDPVDAVPADDDREEPPRHYSTGRLTGAQAAVVNTWRDRLLEDRPLPGDRPTRTSPLMRLVGFDDRPRASCSDVIAAAVVDLLAKAPDELDIARYGETTSLAHKTAAERHLDDAQAPRFPPVSFYLPADIADRFDEIRRRTSHHIAQELHELREEAKRRFPRPAQAQDRANWYARERHRLGLPARARRIPAGVLARMAIDRWRRRSVDKVVTDAVAYAKAVHVQPHRARQDMHQLRR